MDRKIAYMNDIDYTRGLADGRQFSNELWFIAGVITGLALAGAVVILAALAR